MTYSFPGHPAGAAGVALLLLRFGAALMIAGACYYAGRSSLDTLVLIASGLAILLLLLGLGTRAVALTCAVIALGMGAIESDWRIVAIAVQGFNLIAIALLGAGAYSIDAYLFGRRVIKLDN
jgi:putative oxidoreductase